MSSFFSWYDLYIDLSVARVHIIWHTTLAIMLMFVQKACSYTFPMSNRQIVAGESAAAFLDFPSNYKSTSRFLRVWGDIVTCQRVRSSLGTLSNHGTQRNSIMKQRHFWKKCEGKYHLTCLVGSVRHSCASRTTPFGEKGYHPTMIALRSFHVCKMGSWSLSFN